MSPGPTLFPDDPGYFGLSYHLLHFRTEHKSYQALLEATRETLETREIPMPFCAEDVFGRHLLIGGEHARRSRAMHYDMRPTGTFANQLIRMLERQQANEDENEEASEPEDSIETMLSKQAFLELILNDDAVDLKQDHMNLRLYKEFLKHAHLCGDLIEAKNMPRDWYCLTKGGYVAENMPRGKDSVFYDHENVKKQRDAKRGLHIVR